MKLKKNTGKFQILIFVLTVAFSTSVFGQVSVTKTEQNADANYRIGIGDVLKIIVSKNELLSLDNVRVSNTGTIRLPMLEGEIPVICQTEAQLADTIAARYKKYLLNPQIYVAVQEFNSNPVAVVGAVIAPGRFQLQRPMRLLELLSRVNGASPTAGRTVQIIRSKNSQSCIASGENTSELALDVRSDESEVLLIPLAQTMKGNDEANPYIHAGDIVRVSEAEQAYIIGNVRSAKAISLNEPVTLSKAVAMAGGVTPEAEIKKIRILRQEPDSLKKTELIVNLKDINALKEEDVYLQPDDIIEVPGPSGTKKFLKDVLKTVLPSLTRFPVMLP